jgi:hypothetical protein
MAKAKGNMLGAWAFLGGVILAIIIGLVPGTPAWTTLVLLIIGLIVGLLNVTATEAKEFMLASTALVIVSALGGSALMALNVAGLQIGGIFAALVAMFVPATIIVALKAVFALAKD